MKELSSKNQQHKTGYMKNNTDNKAKLNKPERVNRTT